MTEQPPPATLTTTTSKRWLLKFGVFFIAALVLGAWFWYDGLVSWPATGREHARFTLLSYFQALETENQLRRSLASVEQPAQTFQQLSDKPERTAVENARLDWLRSLSRIAELDELAGSQPDPDATPDDPDWYLVTSFPTPRESLAELDTYFRGRDTPTALAAYDIPVQLILGTICTIVFVVVLIRIAKTLTTSYRYDPQQHRITGPGIDVTPEQIELIDKRKWDKFLVFVQYKDDRPEHKLDLYKHEPLEDWVLEVEKLTDSYEPEPDPDDNTLLLADVITATAQTASLPDDAQPPFVLNDPNQRPARYPTFKDSAGRWWIIGKRERQRLNDAANNNELPREQIHADLHTFQATINTVIEHTPDQQPSESHDTPDHHTTDPDTDPDAAATQPTAAKPD